jgi:hypothetical protein
MRKLSKMNHFKKKKKLMKKKRNILNRTEDEE